MAGFTLAIAFFSNRFQDKQLPENQLSGVADTQESMPVRHPGVAL
jgi:hypothetical protein